MLQIIKDAAVGTKVEITTPDSTSVFKKKEGGWIVVSVAAINQQTVRW